MLDLDVGGSTVERTQFGRYELLEQLGVGASGRLYKAFDSATDRVVAVRILPADLARDEDFQERFQQDMHAWASLSEPHVVPIHNFGEIEGQPFVDMRFIHGRGLDAILAEGRLSPTRAVSMIHQVASALDAAHRVGMMHRDLKPSHILVDDRDFVYLADFGVARGAQEAGLTATGTAVDTFACMAPERLTSGVADPRTDEYALTCVLYQCLTGEPPYPGDTPSRQLTGHLVSPPPRPSALAEEVPSALDEVIAKGLAKNPDDRYQSAAEMAEAARKALTGSTVEPLPTARIDEIEAVAPPSAGPPTTGTVRPPPRPAGPPPTETVRPQTRPSAPASPPYSTPPPSPRGEYEYGQGGYGQGAPPPQQPSYRPPPQQPSYRPPPQQQPSYQQPPPRPGGYPPPSYPPRPPRPGGYPPPRPPYPPRPASPPPRHQRPPYSAPDPVSTTTPIRLRPTALPVDQLVDLAPRPAASGDHVDVSVFAPPRAVRGDALLVQALFHLPEQAEAAATLAIEADSDAGRRGVRSLDIPVEVGTVLAIDLIMPGLDVKDGVQYLRWTGRPEGVQFEVLVPELFARRSVIGTVTVSMNGLPIGHIKWKMPVDPIEGADPAQTIAQGEDATRYTRAFISYASSDRPEVLKRVQLLRTLEISYFQDVLDLDPGDRYERELFHQIDDCDLFLLFWSGEAKQSEWVRREVDAALRIAEEHSPFGRPALRPVLIEGPPVPLPWPELAHLHFNDRLLYLMN